MKRFCEWCTKAKVVAAEIVSTAVFFVVLYVVARHEITPFNSMPFRADHFFLRNGRCWLVAAASHQEDSSQLRPVAAQAGGVPIGATASSTTEQTSVAVSGAFAGLVN